MTRRLIRAVALFVLLTAFVEKLDSPVYGERGQRSVTPARNSEGILTGGVASNKTMVIQVAGHLDGGEVTRSTSTYGFPPVQAPPRRAWC